MLCNMRPTAAAETQSTPIIFVVSGPSGVGKGTVLSQVIRPGSGLRLSVSATSREPRDTEDEGAAYHFMERDEFLRLVAADGFLEHAEYSEHLYGTPVDELDRALAEGQDLVLEIEVQGARQVRARRPEAVAVMVLPPSLEEWARRLEERGTESREQIEKRMAIGREEIVAAGEFDYIVVNDQIERAAADVEAIVRAERLRSRRGVPAVV